MSEFAIYFVLGREHILDYTNGYDHILFVLALCAVFVVRDWRKILVLVTAFTVGHSVTLALATLDMIRFNIDLIEFLIPVTIFITAISNLLLKEVAIESGKKIQFNYFLALIFGLVHGMGFSNYLKAILGKNESIVMQLLAFNLGLEFGQLIIVTIFMGITFVLIRWANVSRRDWRIVISSAIAGIALILIKNNAFW
jgi:hypothetical protein